MKPKYVLTDLDGTLLRSDATVSDYTVRVLTTALQQDLVVSYATARSHASADRVVSAIPWRYPALLYNGAVMFDPVTNKWLDGCWLEREIVDGIIGIGRSCRLLPFLFALDQQDQERVLHEKLVRSGDAQFVESRPGDPRFRQVPRLECPETYRVVGVTYIGLQDELVPFKARIEQRYGHDVHSHLMKDQYIADHYFLEFSHPQANKRDGLVRWAGRMGCRPADIMVFGDNLNDLGMFEAAGTAIAVANARPELLKAANRVAESNDGDGVAKMIGAWIRG